ncbi:MAG TPA: hypothetical protein VIU63_00410, partial [Nitrospira sp.]
MRKRRTIVGSKQMKPLLGITMGDPAGIGPEVIAKALAQPRLRRLCVPMVIGSLPVMRQTAKRLKLAVDVVPVEGHENRDAFRSGRIAVLDPLEQP